MAVIAGIISLLAYLRALTCDFVNFDDPDYLLQAVAVARPDTDSLLAILTRPYVGLWMPLTRISFVIDYLLWGQHPAGYHLTNIVLHALNTGLVVLLADRLMLSAGNRVLETRYYPAALLLAGLLWGLHPLRVESVAWVSERKDVLNGLFTLGTIHSYLVYAEMRRTVGWDAASTKKYAVCLLLFSCSLMAKPVSVVLPFMLLMLDRYPLARLDRARLLPLVIEKIPFFVMSFLLSCITVYWGARNDFLQPLEFLSPFSRLLVSGNAVFEYIRLQLVPFGILPLYVLPNPLPVSYTITTLVLLAGVAACLYAGRKSGWPLVTFSCFILPLLPVLAFLQNGIQAYAARYTYLPSVAPSIALAMLLAVVCSRAEDVRKLRLCMYLAVLPVAVILFYGAMTYRMIGVWENTASFWSRVIESQPRGSSYQKRGMYYLDAGNFQAAYEDFSAAIEFAARAKLPVIHELYGLRGTALAGMHRYEDAVADFTLALDGTSLPLYYYHRGQALQALGRQAEAENDFNRGKPDPLAP